MRHIETINGCDIIGGFGEFYVYGCTYSGDPMTALTLDMARAIAAAHGLR